MPDRGKTRGSKHSNFSWIPAWDEEMITIEVNQVNADTIENGSHIGVPLWEDVIPMLHPTSVLDIRAGFPSQTFGTLEKNHPPATNCQLAGYNHASQTSADNDSRRRSHISCLFLNITHKYAR